MSSGAPPGSQGSSPALPEVVSADIPVPQVLSEPQAPATDADAHAPQNLLSEPQGLRSKSQAKTNFKEIIAVKGGIADESSAGGTQLP